MAWGGIDAESGAEAAEELHAGFARRAEPCRPGADPRVIAAWEHRHGFRLPRGPARLADALQRALSQRPADPPALGDRADGPVRRIPDLVVQPESWFELGNPNVETICIDLAYRWPGGGIPSSPRATRRPAARPRSIAPSFEEWFLELLRHGGREYWFDPGFVDFGDPWQAHRRYTPPPALPDRLRPLYSAGLASHAGPGPTTVRSPALLGLSRGDVELLFRHLQHVASDLTPF